MLILIASSPSVKEIKGVCISDETLRVAAPVTVPDKASPAIVTEPAPEFALASVLIKSVPS